MKPLEIFKFIKSMRKMWYVYMIEFDLAVGNGVGKWMELEIMFIKISRLGKTNNTCFLSPAEFRFKFM